MGTLRTMDKSGDTKVIWDPSNPNEVEAARTMYDKLVAKRFQPFGVAAKGEKGVKISAFDPDIAQIIMVPPMAGG